MPPDPLDDDRRDESNANGDPDGERRRSGDPARSDGGSDPVPPDDRDEERRSGEPDEARRSDDRDEKRRSDGPAGSSDGDLLSSLLNALESLDRISGSDRRRGSSGRLDYDVSIRSGLGALDSGSNRERKRTGRPGSEPARSRGRPSSGRSNRRRRRSTSSYRTEVRTEADRLWIVADVAGADPEAVTVGYDDADIVVAVDGREIERAEVPWPDPTANARVKNGVLTVTLERGGEGGE